MTFKHVKFEDSPTMRALEKVAREKGLVKPEPLTKKASLTKKADLTPTANLMENVFKLCNGLRQQGMVKQASELETKYLQFKQAQTLYETSKETGEDVVEQAHPEGSHKLENVDSVEAVVEDILDKHDLIEEVAEKNPKGNLPEGKNVTSEDVIRAVRILFAQEAVDKQKLLDGARASLNKVVNEITTLNNKTSGELTISLEGYLGNISNRAKEATIDNIKAIQSLLSRLRYRLKPGIMMGISEDLWSRVQPYLNAADAAAAKALELRTQYNQAEAAAAEKQEGEPGAGDAGQTPGGPGLGKTERPGGTDPSLAKINQAKQGINGIAGLVAADTTADPNDVRDVNAWIAKIRGALKTLEDNYKSMNAEDVDAALAKITKDFATVRQEWA